MKKKTLKPGSKDGRPTTYKPEYCEQLIEDMKNGYTYEAFASRCNVAVSSLYRWEEAHPDFREAKKIGKAHLIRANESLFRDAVTGKNARINPTLLIFLMKNCNGWRDKVEVEEVTSLPTQDLLTLAKQTLKEIEDESNYTIN